MHRAKPADHLRSRFGGSAWAALALAVVASACQAPPAEAEAIRGDKDAAGPVVVSTAVVQTQNVALWRDAVGTVNAFYSVTVHAQVDGRLDEVCFAEGQAVKKGDVLALIDPRPYAIALKTAQAALMRDRATARNAAVNAQRYQSLRSDNMVSEQQLTDQQAVVASSQATVLADEAAVLQANLQLDYARIKAPIDGITGLRLVDPGNVVRASDTNGLLVINQLDPIAVLFSLPEDELPEVLAWMRQGPLQVEAYARNGQTLLGRGHVSLVDNQINVASGTIRIKAVFENNDHRLWPNQFVKVRLRLAELPGHAMIPASALVGATASPSVFVVTKEKKAKKVAVAVRAMQAENAIVADVFEAGARVVVDGQRQLHDGSAVAERTKAAKVPTPPPSKPAP